MTKTHRTKEGKVLFVSEMDDAHLENTIKYILRKVLKIRVFLNSGRLKGPSVFKAALYDIDVEEDYIYE